MPDNVWKEVPSPMHEEGLENVSHEETRNRVFELARKIRGDRERIYGMVQWIADSLQIPPLVKEDIVVDIGCGDGTEICPINSALSQKDFGFRGDCEFVVIDIEKRAIAGSRYWGGATRYIHDDARELDVLLKGKQPIVIVSRNPNILELEKEKAWREIFQKAYTQLKPKGWIITTTEQSNERDLVKDALEKAGFQIVMDRLSLFFAGDEIATYNKETTRYDKFITVGRKQ